MKLSHDKDKLQDEREPIACDTLEVSNVPPNVTNDYLQLYFESASKSGGCVDCVKNITMVKPGVFHVQFTDATSKLS